MYYFCKENKIGISNTLLQIIEPILLENGQYQCPLCDNKIMKTKAKIARHILIHTGEKPYACSACSYATHEGANLKRHFNNMHC